MKRSNRINPYYPLFLNVTGKKSVVVGGGLVAFRKIQTLLEHGALVTIVSPEICWEINDLRENNKVHILHRDYRTGDLQGAFIVIAATNIASTNKAIATEAKEKGILLNVVDDADNSDFILPSYLNRGDLTIAISTAGMSPALARKIRTRLEKEYGDEYASLLLLINQVREEIKNQDITVSNDKWQEALDLDLFIDMLKQGHHEKARDVLFNTLKSDSK